MQRIRNIATFAALLLLVLGSSERAFAQSPSDVVASINDALIEAMKGGAELGFEGRYEILEPVLTSAYNFPAMIKVIIGRAKWNEFSEDQRTEVTSKFAEMSISTFAARFKNHTGQTFQILGEQAGARGSVVVENQLLNPGKENVTINYVLRKFDEAWRVIDVQLGGTTSELATRRSEYGAVLARDGYDGLVQMISEKIADLRTAKPSNTRQSNSANGLSVDGSGAAAAVENTTPN